MECDQGGLASLARQQKFVRRKYFHGIKGSFIKVDCTDDCQAMCMCNEGFHRADNGECVPCSNEPVCGLNEHFEECGSQCRDETCPCPPDVECDEEMSYYFD